MGDAEAQALYERRLAIWGRACILCSYLRRERVPFPYQGCMQSQFYESMSLFRRSVRFQPGIGCFRCGQPEFVCMQRGQAGCQFPWFVFHCCWVAVHQDYEYTVDLYSSLGGPALPSHAAVSSQHFLRWVGQSRFIFGRHRGSNAVRLAYFWVDRLEQLCSE